MDFTLGVAVDYLIGHSDHIIMDKGLVRRMEDIEALPSEEKDKVYYLIDMALAYNKTKKSLPFKHPAIAVNPKLRRVYLLRPKRRQASFVDRPAEGGMYVQKHNLQV